MCQTWIVLGFQSVNPKKEDTYQEELLVANCTVFLPTESTLVKELLKSYFHQYGLKFPLSNQTYIAISHQHLH